MCVCAYSCLALDFIPIIAITRNIYLLKTSFKQNFIPS